MKNKFFKLDFAPASRNRRKIHVLLKGMVIHMKITLVLAACRDLPRALAGLWQSAENIFTADDDITLWLPDTPPEAAELLSLPGEITSVCCRERPPCRSFSLGVHPNPTRNDTGVVPYETSAAWLTQQTKTYRPDLLLFHGNRLGQELAARLAAKTGQEKNLCTAVTQIEREKDSIAYTRRICSNHLEWMQQGTPPQVLSLVSSLREPPPNWQIRPQIWTSAPLPHTEESYVISSEIKENAALDGIESAKKLVICGKGLGTAAVAEKLRRFAKAYGFTAAFTRAAALNGWGRPEEVVGQSGKSAAAEICLVLGASGASAFLAGIEHAGTIIAVNTDENAPIFRHCNYGILADAESVLDILLENHE